MWVAPDARGLGLAQRMLEALEAHAASKALHTLRLDTNRSLAAARALYQRTGYREVAPYNDNPYAAHWFQKDGITAPQREKAVRTPSRLKQGAPGPGPRTDRDASCGGVRPGRQRGKNG